MAPTSGCLACFGKISFLQPHPISYIQLFLHGLSLLFGFLVCIPVGITLRRFDGTCILFAQVVWDGYHIWPWSDPSCDFIMFMNIGINIVYNILSIFFIVILVLPKFRQERVKDVDHIGLLGKYQTDYVVTNMNPLMTVINSLIWAFQIAGAIVITVGLSQFCNSLEKSLEERGESMSCAEAERKLDWSQYTMMQSEVDEGVDGRGFFISLNIATICSWILLCLWTFQLVLNIGQVCNRCSCEIAEEKVKIDVSQRIAARRSRMATPSGTPGAGRHTPVGYGQPMPPPSVRGPPSTSSYMQQPPRGQQQSMVLQAPPGWGQGPQSTSSLA